MAQAEALQAQAALLKKEEVELALTEIRNLMAQYDLTVDDIAPRGRRLGGRPIRAGKSNSEPKYKGPNGELWAGGPGRKPEWVKAVMAEGKSIEDFRI